jgi:hypothetical protein
MSKSAAMEVCRTWIETALAGLNAVIYLHTSPADAGRPSIPYAGIEWAGDRSMSATPYRSVPDTETHPGDPDGRTHDLHVQERRRGVLRIHFYGPGGYDYAIELGHSVHREAERALLRQGGVSVHQISDILDTDELRDTIWEQSATVDYAVIYAAEEKSPIGIIETANTPITLEDPV